MSPSAPTRGGLAGGAAPRAAQPGVAAGTVQAVVEECADALSRPFDAHDRSQKLGPTGSLNGPGAMR